MAHTMERRRITHDKRHIISFYNTGASAVAETIAPGVSFKLESLRIHFSDTTASENLTLTLDHDLGANYDAVLYSYDINGGESFVKTFTGDDDIGSFYKDIEIDIAYANTNNRTWGLEITVEVF